MTKREIRRLRAAANRLSREVGDLFTWSERYGDILPKLEMEEFSHCLHALDKMSYRLLDRAEAAEE